MGAHSANTVSSLAVPFLHPSPEESCTAAGSVVLKHAEGSPEEITLGKEATAAGASVEQLGHLIWALAVGASLTLRLWCSVRLMAPMGDADPFVVSCHVATRLILLSAVCLMPFASWQALPRTKGPWLAGICTLPSFSLIASASILGFGLSQMALKLSILSSALALDSAGGRLTKWEIQRRMLGTAIVLIGVAVAAFGPGVGMAVTFGPLVLLSLLGTAASGAGYVLQTRLSTVSAPPSHTVGITAEQAEATSAVVCQLVSAVVQAATLLVLVLYGSTTLGALPMRSCDAPLWAFAGFQGAFYLRSMQLLSKRVGLATAFTVSLCGQLLSATVLDMLKQNRIPSSSCMLGLVFIICGAAIGSSGGASRSRTPSPWSATAHIASFQVKSIWPSPGRKATNSDDVRNSDDLERCPSENALTP